MKWNLLTIEIRCEQDVVLVRQRARQIAALLGYSSPEQTAVATAVSEIARNAFQYATGGRAEFAIDSVQPQQLVITISDRGPGIGDLDAILGGRYVSSTGMGLGIVGSRRLSDRFDIDSRAGQGTTVTLGKRLPRHGKPVTHDQLDTITRELARIVPQPAFAELQTQNQELLYAMDEARIRQTEVERLNAELSETNRGVLALYAELDDKALSLSRASQYKSQFLSNMGHELRTPLNAMISISGLLLDRVDGELTDEQEKQVRFIRKSAESLREMVNDLLDLAKIESGKFDVHVAEFDVSELFAALRGMFRPLLAKGGAELLIDDPAQPVRLETDQPKVAQVLRNFVSNALKFTEHGVVRVTVECEADGFARFDVVDSGIGIAAEHLEHIFEEFVQVDSAIQRRVKGTGLGLPLARRLATLLGGEVSVKSKLGVGSTFSLRIPMVCTSGTRSSDEDGEEQEAEPVKHA